MLEAINLIWKFYKFVFTLSYFLRLPYWLIVSKLHWQLSYGELHGAVFGLVHAREWVHQDGGFVMFCLGLGTQELRGLLPWSSFYFFKTVHLQLVLFIMCYRLGFIFKQGCGSIRFWRGSGSGSSDPHFGIVDPDPDPRIHLLRIVDPDPDPQIHLWK